VGRGGVACGSGRVCGSACAWGAVAAGCVCVVGVLCSKKAEVNQCCAWGEVPERLRRHMVDPSRQAQCVTSGTIMSPGPVATVAIPPMPPAGECRGQYRREAGGPPRQCSGVRGAASRGRPRLTNCWSALGNRSGGPGNAGWVICLHTGGSLVYTPARAARPAVRPLALPSSLTGVLNEEKEA